ncbi:Calcineurin B homologous protein 1 [Toxocara canis]|uniref:Calcineurin B homologous protein 1 n=1 Tax=Toxocara canis TaxID=6265 RepID=A0A0B2W1X2_TOXCA|nr:Calcineurin B homologous protein 1 [Toxocara canis]
MGNCRSFIRPPSLTQEETEALAKETGFTNRQILRLHSRFLSLDKDGKGVLDRDDFFNIPELEVNPLGDRIIDAFFAETKDPEKRITFGEFANVLAHFRPCTATSTDPSRDNKHLQNNSREEKLKFAFAMYDLNKNGYITRYEFKVILNMMVGSNITPEQLDSITDRTITEGDYEKNGKISFQEFCRAMESINIEELMSIRFLD